jgi:hypothetical protein
VRGGRPGSAGPPSTLLDRARALGRGELEVVPPRDAATVALLRDARDGVEVYLLRRVRAMAFAGGMHVFPGGAVDPADAEEPVGPGGGWTGPPPSAFAAAWAVRAARPGAWCGRPSGRPSRSAGCCSPGRPRRRSSRTWARRVGGRAGRPGVREQVAVQLLARRGLLLRADLLRPCAHWITPEVEPERFDTRFFVARLPAGPALPGGGQRGGPAAVGAAAGRAGPGPRDDGAHGGRAGRPRRGARRRRRAVRDPGRSAGAAGGARRGRRLAFRLPDEPA